MELRRGAARTHPDAARLWFTRDGLEQATAAPLAAWRARQLDPAARVADLCCGLGLDLLALAEGRRGTVAVDADPVHVALARRNADALGREVTVAEADVVVAVDEGLLGCTDVAFVDPARRGTGRRRPDPASWSPPLAWCLALAGRVPGVVVKAAPGLDRGSVPPGWSLAAVSVRRGMRELVLASPALRWPDRTAVVHAGDDASGGPVHELHGAPGDEVPLGPVDAVVLDPDPAVTRAGLVQDLARHLGARRVDGRTAVLTLPHPVATPFARVLRVEASLPFSLRALRTELARLDVGAVDLRRRGLAGDVEDLRRRLRLRGSRRVFVLLTRVADRPWVVVGS